MRGKSHVENEGSPTENEGNHMESEGSPVEMKETHGKCRNSNGSKGDLMEMKEV